MDNKLRKVIELWKKVDGRTRDVVLLLYNTKGYLPKSVVAKTIGTHRVYIHRIYKKLEKEGIINNGKLNKNKVKIKKFSIEVFKKRMSGSTLGVFISFILSFIFTDYSAFIILGSMTVFVLHALSVLIELLKINENIEVYVNCNH